MRERVYRVSKSLRSLDGEENGWKVAGRWSPSPPPREYLPVGPGLVILLPGGEAGGDSVTI